MRTRMIDRSLCVCTQKNKPSQAKSSLPYGKRVCQELFLQNGKKGLARQFNVVRQPLDICGVARILILSL